MWFEMERASMGWREDAHTRFHNDIVLSAPPEVVFDILVDPEQWPLWFPEMRRVEWLTDFDPGVGSRRVAHLDLLSVREEFLVWEPGERFAFCALATTLPLANWLIEEYRLEERSGGRCRLDWDVYFEPRWYLRPAVPVFGGFFAGMFEEGIAQLADYVDRTAAAGAHGER